MFGKHNYPAEYFISKKFTYNQTEEKPKNGKQLAKPSSFLT